MGDRIVLYLIITVFCVQIIKSSPTAVSVKNSTISKLLQEDDLDQTENKASNSKTIEELVLQQTENVKKIVADQTQQTRLEYPVVTKLEPQYTEEAKKEIEKLSLEEIKIKCQHLLKPPTVNKTSENGKPVDQNIIQGTSTRRVNHRPIDLQKRPVYVHPRPSFRPKQPTTPKPVGFYITAPQSSTTTKPAGNTQPPIKYIRLEPVILQKTILNDGRIVYYWHRSLPTAVEFTNDATQNNYVPNSSEYTYPSYNSYVSPIRNGYVNTPPYGYIPLPQNGYMSAAHNLYTPQYQTIYTSTTNYLGENQNPIELTTETSTTSTTEQSSYSGYGFGSFLPFYSLTRQDSTTTTTTEPTTTTTTTTTPEPTTEKLKTDDLLYAQQLKFIIPVPYENVNGGANIVRPWNFDQYAYYPKELQPNAMNVQVPYTPTFHMITAVAVPNSEGNLNEKVDDVAV